ncbi:MAG TPA: peptidyl-prolyl cis-trans isomerase [Kofleriaceae bacterium]|nr:peptidyl-prolyl cis-trans isomerase [Kofleriaceae bacterium]
MVACFDANPVTASEVREHLRPGSPREAALEAALRVRVFAAEAHERGLEGGDGRDGRSRAVLNQALLRDEVARAKARPDDVSLDEARRYYEARPGEFNRITGTWVRGIFAADAAAAEAAYGSVRALDDAAFAAAGGEDLGEAHADGVDPALRRLANDLRAAGDVKGPALLGDGRWVILRATRIELAAKPFDEAARDVQHALARRRQEAALDALYASLAGAHRIARFDAELALVPEPTEPAR